MAIVKIPAALMGSAIIAFDTLCTKHLAKKDEKKLITILNNTAKALAVAHRRDPPKGKLVGVHKKLDIITGDVIYELIYGEHEC